MPLVETTITTVDQIDDVLDLAAGAMPVGPDTMKAAPRFLTEELLHKWRKERGPNPRECRDELLYRRDRLRVTLTKLHGQAAMSQPSLMRCTACG